MSTRQYEADDRHFAKNISYFLRPGETHRESARRSRREDRRSSRPLLREQPRAKRAAVPKAKPYGPSSCSSPPHLVYETRYKHPEREEFRLANDALDARLKVLKRTGEAKPAKHKAIITDADLERLGNWLGTSRASSAR